MKNLMFLLMFALCTAGFVSGNARNVAASDQASMIQQDLPGGLVIVVEWDQTRNGEGVFDVLLSDAHIPSNSVLDAFQGDAEGTITFHYVVGGVTVNHTWGWSVQSVIEGNLHIAVEDDSNF